MCLSYSLGLHPSLHSQGATVGLSCCLGLHPYLHSLSCNQILRAAFLAFAAAFEGVFETLCFGEKPSTAEPRGGRELVKSLRMATSYQLVAHLVFCILRVASLLPHYFEAT